MAAATLPTAGSPSLVKAPTTKPASFSPRTSKSSNSRLNEIVRHGDNCIALAEGKDPIAVAVGKNSSAAIKASEDSYMACAVAVGTGCNVEMNGEHSGVIAAVAIGMRSTAISFVKEVGSIAIGYEPYAVAPDGGTAIAMGEGPSAQAGEGGYLVFVDTSGVEPKTAVFAVDPDRGIWPDIPYCWEDGWTMPRPDDERIDHEGFERGEKFAKG